jgi:hypothetical protein
MTAQRLQRSGLSLSVSQKCYRNGVVIASLDADDNRASVRCLVRSSIAYHDRIRRPTFRENRQRHQPSGTRSSVLC